MPGEQEPSLLCLPESPLRVLALSASQTPAGNPRACQGGPDCLSGFSSLSKKPPYTPLRHPQPPWPGDDRGVSACKGSSAPGREMGVCILGTGFRDSHVSWSPMSRGSVPLQELAPRRLAPPVSSFVAPGTVLKANNRSTQPARLCWEHFAYFTS